MITTKLAMCSEQVLIDNSTNAISAINIYEDMTYPVYPVLLQKFTFLWILDRDETDPERPAGVMEVWLNGKSLYTFDTKIDFAGLLSVRAFVIVSGLTVPEPGKMVTSFRLENKEHATYVMHMHAAPGARKA